MGSGGDNKGVELMLSTYAELMKSLSGGAADSPCGLVPKSKPTGGCIMYTGEVKQAASGQWAWCVCEDGVAIVSGAGYDTEEEAEVDMTEELAEYQGRTA